MENLVYKNKGEFRVIDQRFLGDDSFVERVEERVLDREVGGFSNQEMAQALAQDASVVSRGLRKLEGEMEVDRELQTVVQGLCHTLRKGRKPKRSISHA